MSVVFSSGARISIREDGSIVASIVAIAADTVATLAELADLEIAVCALTIAMWRAEYEFERELPELVDVGGEA